ERQNRYQPDLRREVGFYAQHKICLSDENNVLRSIFQLSLIPPADRDPDRLWADRKAKTVNLAEFEKLCKAHPQLVRRLHTPPLPNDPRREYPKFRCKSAAEVVRFLEDHANVPSLYVDKEESAKDFEQRSPKDNDLERFP